MFKGYFGASSKSSEESSVQAPARQGLMSITGHPLVRRLRRLVTQVLLAFTLASMVSVLLLRWLPPPTSSFMVQQRLENFFTASESTVRYQWAPYEEISPYLALAVVAGEDQKFPFHNGFDFAAVHQAITDSLEGEPLRGASTITQQVAKNLFLWPGRSILRKGLEIWFTILIETFWSKQRILEVYLNIVELGEQTYGAQAASRRFFGKPARGLSEREAALLAAVLPNPVLYRVDAPSGHVRRRQAWILRQMRQLGGTSYLERL